MTPWLLWTFRLTGLIFVFVLYVIIPLLILPCGVDPSCSSASSSCFLGLKSGWCRPAKHSAAFAVCVSSLFVPIFFASLTSSTSSPLSSVTLTEQLLEFMHQLPAFANMTMSVRRELCAVMVFAVVERAGTIVLNDGEEVCKSVYIYLSVSQDTKL